MHFKLILEQGERQGSSFSLLYVAIQFSQYHLLNRLSFLQLKFWASLSKTKWLQLLALISGSSILFPCSMYLFLCQYHAVLTAMDLKYNLILYYANILPVRLQWKSSYSLNLGLPLWYLIWQGYFKRIQR
jgi:hypothetical protein